MNNPLLYINSAKTEQDEESLQKNFDSRKETPKRNNKGLETTIVSLAQVLPMKDIIIMIKTSNHQYEGNLRKYDIQTKTVSIEILEKKIDFAIEEIEEINIIKIR